MFILWLDTLNDINSVNVTLNACTLEDFSIQIKSQIIMYSTVMYSTVLNCTVLPFHIKNCLLTCIRNKLVLKSENKNLCVDVKNMRLDLERNFRIMREKSTSGFAEKIRIFKPKAIHHNNFCWSDSGPDTIQFSIFNFFMPRPKKDRNVLKFYFHPEAGS